MNFRVSMREVLAELKEYAETFNDAAQSFSLHILSTLGHRR